MSLLHQRLSTNLAIPRSHWRPPQQLLHAQAAAAPAEEAGPADDLTRIKLIDYFIQQRLKHLGVRTFEDIAGWTGSDVARVSQTLGFYGRIEQENWIEQAKILVRGGSVRICSPSAHRKTVAAAVAVPLAADRLHRIIGIDPATEELLIANGVTGIADIARLDVGRRPGGRRAHRQAGPGRPRELDRAGAISTRGGAPRASEQYEHAPITLLPEPEPVARGAGTHSWNLSLARTRTGS